jgi:tetratricopeptide (TPR) repeat protein
MRQGERKHDFSAGMALSDVAVEDLPSLGFSRPADTARVAEHLLATTRDPRVRSYAGQALGIATREMGDVDRAVRYLRAALAAATSCGADREADVHASLGATLAFAGRSSEALRHMDAALGKASGVTAARVRVRRGVVLQILGRTREAIEEHRRAARTLHTAGDTTWEARALNNLGNALIDRGDARSAEAALIRAEALMTEAGMLFDAAIARHNRGLVASLLGRVPEALAHFDTAEKMYADAGARPAELSEVRSAALLAVGLHADALRHGQEAVDILRSRGASAAYLANALVRGGDAALAVGSLELARSYAAEAGRLFRRQGRERGETLARLMVIRARHASGEGSRRLLRDAAGVAAAADRHSVAEAVEAHLLAGQIALGVHDQAAAKSHLLRAARSRSRGSALRRVIGWHAAALRSDAVGRRNAVFDACERGLQILDAYKLTLGAVEMQASATAHGAALAEIAIQHALAANDPRALLRWAERWRATTSTIPPVRPPDDEELAADLATLRQLTRRLNDATVEGRPTPTLERERRRLEDSVRSRVLRTSGTDFAANTEHVDVDELLATLGDTRLVEILQVDGELTVLVAAAGRVRKFSAGRLAEAAREVDYARFALRGAAGTGGSRAAVALRRLETGGPRLQEMLFGDAVRALGDGPLIVVPPARLHATPWGVLPALRNRPFAVAPSAASWLRAVTRRAPRRRDVVLVAGPNLGSRGAEVTTLRRTYEDARVLANGAATCEDALKALNGAWLAHVAAHGVLRADNPLFSALTLDDGPLTVYDLERLRRAPYRLILSACESGIGTTAGADEVLGLASAVISLGTAGLLGSTVIVDDDAAVQVSLIVHEHLRAGADLAHALYRARQATAGDPVAHATSLAFLALGAA